MPYIRLDTRCLRTSLHFKFTSAERCLWYEMLMMSKVSPFPGWLQQSPESGYPLSFIAAQLRGSIPFIKKALVKFELEGMISTNSDGCITIKNWLLYQAPYDYHKGEQKESKPVSDDILDANLGAIHQCYEENIGLLTPILADQLRDISDTYPEGWFEKATAIACEKNARNLKYISKILQRWQVDGVDSGAGKTTGHERIQVYKDD